MTDTEWINELKRRIAKTSQSAVRRELAKDQPDGFPSETTLSQIVNQKYPSQGAYDRLQAIVEGAYLGKTVECPEVGEIPRDQCQEFQARKYAATNPLRIALYERCNGGTCPHSAKYKGEAS